MLRAIATTIGIGGAAYYGDLVDAMVALCIVNAITLIGYSWAVFRVDGIPFLPGLLTSCRSMITSFIMAIGVRVFLGAFDDKLTSAYAQVIAGALVGGVLYGILFLLTERVLVKKVLAMVRKRGGGPATEASSA